MFAFQISFAVPSDAIPGRMGLLLTTFLCQINTFNSVARSSPKADGEATAIVMWITACMSFIILALAEYFLILLMKKYALFKNPKVEDSSSKKLFLKKEDLTAEQEELQENLAKKLDKAMLVLSPLMFILFSTVFWHVVNTPSL